MSLGLALGSGGARGWCHIGVLRQLEKNGITPDVVAGCSMGALVGAAWAAGKLDALENWALGLTQTRFFGFIDPAVDKGGLIKGGAVEDLLRAIDLPERIEDLPKPYLAVATDMSTGREIWLQDGPLAPAVRASVSIPGVFAPTQVNGHWLLDGGLINPVPVTACRALGATRTIAVNPNAKMGRPLWTASQSDTIWKQLGTDEIKPHLPEVLSDLIPEGRTVEKSPAMMEVLSASIDVLTEFLRQTRAACDPSDLLLDADLGHMSVVELFRAQEAISEGERIAKAQMGAIQGLTT
ncbi:MAG: patatin-like phospholipase family protein [Pelagimonas sp.]|jgi:NTE family protein|nr:patatin-like phospholipase family protein [Pelagimonas sp.]